MNMAPDRLDSGNGLDGSVVDDGIDLTLDGRELDETVGDFDKDMNMAPNGANSETGVNVLGKHEVVPTPVRNTVPKAAAQKSKAAPKSKVLKATPKRAPTTTLLKATPKNAPKSKLSKATPKNAPKSKPLKATPKKAGTSKVLKAIAKRTSEQKLLKATPKSSPEAAPKAKSKAKAYARKAKDAVEKKLHSVSKLITNM